MEQTSKYGLSQWDAEDRILREDFNADNAKIKAALDNVTEIASAASKLHFGTYKGTVTASQTISLGFTPKIIIVCTEAGMFSDANGNYYGGLAFTGIPCISASTKVLEIVDNGFIAYYSNGNKASANANRTYHYIAVE